MQKSGEGAVTDMFTILIVVMVSHIYTYIKTHHIVNFKYVQLILSQLYCNKAVFKVSMLIEQTREDSSQLKDTKITYQPLAMCAI